jgi:hypothetical protein
MVFLACFHFAVCFPLHTYALKEAPKPWRKEEKMDDNQGKGFTEFIWKAPFLLIACFVVLMMAVTAALPAHMVSLLRENGLNETWVIAIPASIGVIQVLGRLLLYFFEHHFDLDRANRVIPLLIPTGLCFLLLAPMLGDKSMHAVFIFILLFGLGNGMITIVKGTAIAQYVSQENVASLNGVLGFPIALARASAPLMLGLLWSPATGYSKGISVLVALSVAGVVALSCAQKIASRRNCHTDV